MIHGAKAMEVQLTSKTKQDVIHKINHIIFKNCRGTLNLSILLSKID